ncbi:MAG: hypothetical protein RIS02_921, partial [Pseudomonadota bacterium]
VEPHRGFESLRFRQLISLAKLRGYFFAELAG